RRSLFGGSPGMDPAEAEIPERVPGAAGRTHAIPRLGIPSLTLADGPAGLRISPLRESAPDRTFYATAFPVATLLASSWDTALVRSVGEAMGAEVRDYGVDILLAPGMNIHRNPLGGRNFEYYSEDPLVTGEMAAAFVNGVESNGVGTAIKHFVANNAEFNRRKLDTKVSERALREIYLKGFEIAVRQSRPWTVMSSYNLVNGTYTSQDRELLTDILRGEWGFDGFVMTDWRSGDDPVAQVRAGNDLLMPGTPDETRAIIAAVNDGTLDESALDTDVTRILEVVTRSPTFRGLDHSDAPDLEGHARVARQLATDGMVLLKNENDALPLATPGPIALFGNHSYRLVVGGRGSGDVNEAYSIPLVQGLLDAGFFVDATLADLYEPYLAREESKRPWPLPRYPPPEPIAEPWVDPMAIRSAAVNTAAGLVVIGRNSSEGTDRLVEGDFELTDQERDLIRDVAEAFQVEGKPVGVVINSPSVVEVASWRDWPDAILVAWQPGQEGGRAVADVLTGAVNPSGKLTSTFPMAYADVPSAGSFPGEVVPGGEVEGEGFFAVREAEVTYDEGIYVGYRYYDAFYVEPAYPFGYGLSYTTFGYSDLRFGAAVMGDALEATVRITNTGDVAGREVVQLYIEPPAGPVDRPVRELKGFTKTGLLEPGESETVSFTVPTGALAYVDTARAAWVADPGSYTVAIGASSRDIRERASFDVAEERIVQQLENRVTPVEPIDEITPGGM
ncbi:MAG: glycoside hydrolase family 3 N-terminal domain-containing protein, partial [Gemmatimonadota bacterium]